MTTFLEYGSVVLDRRERAGIRGIKSERHRWGKHVSIAAFAPMPIEEIRSTHIRAWVRDMTAKPACGAGEPRTLHPSSAKRSFSLISSVFTSAVEEELRADNPCIGVKFPKLTDERATRDTWAYLTPAEQKAFETCEGITEPDRLAILFALYTGVRQGEQAHGLLRDLHVDGDAPHFYVRFGSKNKAPKSGKPRTVYLNGKALPIAKRWLEVLPTYCPSNPENLVFPTPLGKRRGIGKPLGRAKVNGKHVCAWAEAKKAAGIARKFRWHDLRHSCASSLIAGWWDRKWSMKEASVMLGHSSTQITERYAHLDRDVLRIAASETGVSAQPTATVVVDEPRVVAAARGVIGRVFSFLRSAT